MKRRKFLAGLGATSAGGSALIGTGAFDQVIADRDVDLRIAADSNAYLRIAPCTDDDGEPLPNGAYTRELADGTLALDFSDNDQEPPQGEGVNNRALSKFHNVFEICNQGTQTVCVDLNLGTARDDGSDVPTVEDPPAYAGIEDGDPAVVFYKEDDPSDTYDVTKSGGVDPDQGFELEVGDCQCFGLEVRTFGTDFETGDDLLEDLDLWVEADANADCTLPEPGECGQLSGAFNCVETDDPGPQLGGSRFTVENLGLDDIDEFGIVVLDSPDETEDFAFTVSPDDPAESILIDSPLPLLGIVFWEPTPGCAPVQELPTRDEWENSGLVPDWSSDAIDELDGISQDRYDSVTDESEIEKFEDLEEKYQGDEDLFEFVPENAIVQAIDYSEYVLEYEEGAEDFGSPEAEIDSKYGCDGT